MPKKKLIAFFMAFISLGAVFSFLSSPFFHFQEVSCQGLQRLTEKSIEKTIEPFRQVNILLIDPRQVEKLLLEDQNILAAEVKKIMPDRLQIKIEERVPLARINNNGSYLVFTGDGHILEKGPLRTGEDVPEISGVGYNLNQNLITFTPALAEIVQALTGLRATTLAMISRIDLEGEEYALELKSRTRVYLPPDGELEEIFKILESIIIKMTQEKLLIDYIDLSIPQKPVIRLRD